MRTYGFLLTRICLDVGNSNHAFVPSIQVSWLESVIRGVYRGMFWVLARKWIDFRRNVSDRMLSLSCGYQGSNVGEWKHALGLQGYRTISPAAGKTGVSFRRLEYASNSFGGL